MSKRSALLLGAVALLASAVFPMSLQAEASGPTNKLALKFPAVRDFGEVSAKVLYVRQNLPEGMPLRWMDGRLEAVAGFVPAGKTVTALHAGSPVGSGVSHDGPLSVPVSSVPAGTVLAVAESEEPLSPTWAFRGVAQWSPGKAALVEHGFGSGGNRLAVLVKDPYQYSYSRALAFFDGVTWNRTAATFHFYSYSPIDVRTKGDTFWVLWAVSGYSAKASLHSSDGTVLTSQNAPGFGGRLRSYGNDVLYDSMSRLYRWDEGASSWVDRGPSLGSGPYAERDGRLYGVSGGAVKEYVSDAWRDVFPLPPGVSASQLAVCPDGAIWMVGGDGSTWRRGSNATEWANCGKPLGLTPAVLAAMPDNSVWAAVNVGNNAWAVARWNGGVWVDTGRPVQAPGAEVTKLLPGAGGSLYALVVGNICYSHAGQGLYELPCAIEP